MASKTSSIDTGGLDKSAFKKTMPMINLSIPAKQCGVVQKKCRAFFPRIRLVRPIREDPAHSDRRIVLLDPSKFKGHELCKMKCGDVGGHVEMPRVVVDVVKDILDGEEGKYLLGVKDFEVGFESMTMHEVLRKLLPPTIEEIPSAFEQCGTLAHVNLRDECLPYKRIIGETIMAKNKQIETVVHKTSSIATQFRTFPMEIIAGKDNTVVKLVESGSKFEFDFRSVYWNSRLQAEHRRIVQAIVDGAKSSKGGRGMRVCDMMCGIGPFAIPAALKGCVVYANDLNPESVKYLTRNVATNKVRDRVKIFNMDGREFFRHILASGDEFDHILMNLPAIAIEFLDVFRGGVCDHWTRMPRVHCYCFSMAENVDDMKLDARRRAEKVLGTKLNDATTRIRDVRDVAPRKHMMCVEFDLPRLLRPGSPAPAGGAAKREAEGPCSSIDRGEKKPRSESGGG
eukprot:g1034.t1